MSDTLEIRPGEHGIVRLFAVDLPAEEIAGFAEPDLGADDTPWPLKEALGASYLDSDFVDLFPVGDLAGVGLGGYLTEGLGVAEDDVRPDRARLDAVTGHVLVISSAAFGDEAQTLKPKAPLRWIGTYTEERARVSLDPLPSNSAERTGGNDVAGIQQPAPMSSGRPMTILVIVLVLVLLAVLWLAL